MLSPVNASISSEFVLSPQIIQDGGGQQAVHAARSAAALAILSLASENQASVKLAGLLGTAGVASGDVLTNLALNFGKSINVSPAEGEIVKAFAARLAEAIFSMPALERIAAESKSGLMALGISASALAAAIKNPDSAAAARLVALIETRLTSPRDSALKMAVSNYQATAGREQGSNSVSEPAAKSAVLAQNTQSAARTNERGVEVLRLLQGGKTSGGDGLLANGQLAVRSSASLNTSAGTPQAAAMLPPVVGKIGQVAHAEALSAAGRGDAQVSRQTVMNEAVGADRVVQRDGGHPANGAKPAISSGANSQTSAAISSVLSGTAAAIAAGAARSPGKSAAVADFMREAIARSNSQADVVVAAQKVAAAVAQRQVLLFNAASPSEDGKEDLEKQISRALGNAARASQAATVAIASADQVQQHAAQPLPGVPYAQVPYPQADAEETKRKAARDERDGEQDEGENGDADEQTMQGGDDEQGKEAKRRAQEEPVNDNPFDADEPLDRHASDADRAYHMYQKFGGF